MENPSHDDLDPVGDTEKLRFAREIFPSCPHECHLLNEYRIQRKKLKRRLWVLERQRLKPELFTEFSSWAWSRWWKILGAGIVCIFFIVALCSGARQVLVRSLVSSSNFLLFLSPVIALLSRIDLLDRYDKKTFALSRYDCNFLQDGEIESFSKTPPFLRCFLLSLTKTILASILLGLLALFLASYEEFGMQQFHGDWIKYLFAPIEELKLLIQKG